VIGAVRHTGWRGVCTANNFLTFSLSSLDYVPFNVKNSVPKVCENSDI